MKQISREDFLKILRKNDYKYVRSKGSHFIYENPDGNHITISLNLKSIVYQRLIKENNLME